MVSSVAYPPDGIVKVSFCKQPVTGIQQMLSHGWSLGELGVGATDHHIFSFVFPHGSINFLYLASVLFVQLWVGHTPECLKRAVVTEEATFFCGETLFREQGESTVDGTPGRGPLRGARGRLPDKYKCGGAILLGGIKRAAGRRGVSRWGAL